MSIKYANSDIYKLLKYKTEIKLAFGKGIKSSCADQNTLMSPTIIYKTFSYGV